MKRILKLMLVVVFLITVNLFAQSDEEILELNETMEDVQMEIDEDLQEAGMENLNINITNFSSNTPKMGVFLSDLDFEDIYEMHYDYNYGVYVSGVTVGGPAQNAGIMKGDIIMEFNGEKVKFERHLVNLIKSKQIDDEIDIKFFRLGKIYETKLVLSTLEKKEKNIVITKDGKRKEKLPVGDGSGGWLPIWYKPDVTDINAFLAEMDFEDETFSEDGFLIHGGGGMGNVGKGWFIGGMGAGYSNKKTTKHYWPHYKNGGAAMDTVLVSRKVSYDVGYGGVTLDKRFALSRKFVTAVGFMIGWGGNEYTIKQTDDNGDVPNFDFENDPSGQFDNYYDYKSKLKISSDYILFQPRVTFMWRILDWLSFRTEVGYMLSYSNENWKGKWNGESVKLDNAFDSNMDGLTVSIGPWFGF